jgi:predicted dehydrogenase
VDDAQVEAVMIATPVQLHEEMAIAALNAGKHVLCEKPLSNSVESCRRILERRVPIAGPWPSDSIIATTRP